MKERRNMLEILFFAENAGLFEEDDEGGGSAATQKKSAWSKNAYTLIVWISSDSLRNNKLVMTVNMLELFVWIMLYFRTIMIP